MDRPQGKPAPGAASVHVVAHTHWDREWYLPFEQFRAKLVRLVDGLLDILENDPAFTCFTLDGQTIVLDDYFELRPGNTERLRRLARAGRLQVGPWYVLPDEMLVSGEALIRNLARGTRRALEFGGAMPVGYVPDQFSHTADLPTLFRGFGLDVACLWRGVGPAVGTQAFRWRSPAGSEVLVAYLATAYGNASTLFDEPQETTAKLSQAVGALEPYAVAPVFLLMNGEDHRFPNPSAPELLARAAREAGWPAQTERVRLSSLPAYIAELRRELGDSERTLPSVEAELRSGYRAPVLVGTFSSRLRQKQRCERLDGLLTRAAEPLAAMAWLAGAAPYPEAELEYAWRLALQNQPHDSICGCSVDPVHREIDTRYDKAEQVAGQVVESALLALRDVLAPGPGVVTVINPDLQPVTALVEATVPAGDGGMPRLFDAGGREIPVQPVAAGSDDIIYDLAVSPGQLRAFLPFVSGRQVQGMFINAVTFSRPVPEEVRVEALMGERSVGEFDWQAAKAELGRLMADRSISRLHIIARRSPQRRVAFLAGGVPGLGWKSYRLAAGAESGTGGGAAESLGTAVPDDERARVTGSTSLENAFYRVSVNPDGTLDITDKDGGRTLRGLHRLVDGGDRGDLYTYCPPETDALVDRPVRPVKVRIAESGPVRATLEVGAVYRLPPGLSADRSARRRPKRRDSLFSVSTRVSLVAGEPLVRFVTFFDNAIADHRLQAIFPTGEPFDEHRALSHFSVTRRPAREPVDDPEAWSEPPAGIWSHRGFFGAGSLSVFTKGLPEYTVIGEAASRQPEGAGAALGLTLIRSVGWLSREDLATRPGHAGPGVPTPDGQCFGPHRLEYAVALVAPGQAVTLHRRYTAELHALGGVLPPAAGGASGAAMAGGWLELRPAAASPAPGRGDPGLGSPVVATAVKKGAGDRLVVRLVNYAGQAARVDLVHGEGLGVSSRGTAVAQGSEDLDLGERPLGTARAGSTVGLGPWQTATLAVGLDRG